MLNCLIIDDEPLALQLLEGYINKMPYLKLIAKFDEPLNALPILEHQQIDLLFLDIKMPDISGVDFFRSLAVKPNVIFTTAHSEFAIDGFELNAMDYLLKPIAFEKFMTTCNRVKELVESRNTWSSRNRDYFFINVAHKLQKVSYDDILYLEGFKDYTKIHLASTQGPLLILQNLKYFEDMLERTDFIRIHRSYIVSIRKLNTVSRKYVTINKTTLPVSDNYRENFFSIVNHFTT